MRIGDFKEEPPLLASEGDFHNCNIPWYPLVRLAGSLFHGANRHFGNVGARFHPRLADQFFQGRIGGLFRPGQPHVAHAPSLPFQQALGIIQKGAREKTKREAVFPPRKVKHPFKRGGRARVFQPAVIGQFVHSARIIFQEGPQLPEDGQLLRRTGTLKRFNLCIHESGFRGGHLIPVKAKMQGFLD